MEKKTVGGITYMLMPESKGDHACAGCVADNDAELCSELSLRCQRGIFVEAPKEQPQSRYQIAQEVFGEFQRDTITGKMLFLDFCNYMHTKLESQSDPEYKEYLRLKEKFKE